MRYRLRTLLIVLAVGPMVLAVLCFVARHLYYSLTEIPGIKGLS